MSENYSGWTVEKLKKERQKIDKAIQLAEKRDKKATLAKMALVAKQHGFELHELLSDPAVRGKPDTKIRAARKKSKPRGKVAPKYRNPNNESQTWTGRGRQPLWIKEQLDAGFQLDDLKISS